MTIGRSGVIIERSGTAIEGSGIIIGRLVKSIYAKGIVKNQKHNGEKCTLTPRQRRPGFRPEVRSAFSQVWL